VKTVKWYDIVWLYRKLYILLTLIELIWTITPAVILILIAFPSFKLLYLMDEVMDPSLVIYGEGLGGLTLYIFNKIKYTIYGKKKILFLFLT